MAARRSAAKELADKAKVDDEQEKASTESKVKEDQTQEDKADEKAEKRLQAEVLERKVAQKEAELAAYNERVSKKAKAAQPEFEAVVSSRGYITAYTKG